MTLTIDELFTPATGDEWKEQLLSNASTMHLQTTAWQSGGVTRTVFAIVANLMAQEDGVISIMAQGGFLDFAATGQVTYTAANGKTVTQKVTPDPSVPGENPTGVPGWLDLLASSVYNVTRRGAQYASGTLAIANTSANTYGAFTPGTYHVSNPTTGEGYSNTESLTIASANLVGGTISAASNTTPIVITTASTHGLTGTETVYISGVLGNTAANGFWTITVTSTTSFMLNGSVGNGSYTSGGTVNVCTTGTFAADVSGPGGTSTPGSITSAVTTLTGVLVDNLEAFFGADWESNTALAARCRLKLQSLSPNGPSGAYAYFALTAAQLLSAFDPPVQLSSPITKVKVQTSSSTGIVTTTVASAAGVVPGVSNLAVTGATNASPIVITTAVAHGLSTGDFVTLSGVLGNSNANGTWNITVTGASTFSLDGSSGNAAYTSGGIVEGGDLGEIDRIIQANCVPDDITAITQSASEFDVAIIARVQVPLAQVSLYTANVQIALAAFFASFPIGGIDSSLQYEVVEGVLYAAGQVAGQPSYVQAIPTLTLNSGTIDLTFPSPTHVAVLSPAPSITVVGV